MKRRGTEKQFEVFEFDVDGVRCTFAGSNAT